MNNIINIDLDCALFETLHTIVAPLMNNGATIISFIALLIAALSLFIAFFHDYRTTKEDVKFNFFPSLALRVKLRRYQRDKAICSFLIAEGLNKNELDCLDEITINGEAIKDLSGIEVLEKLKRLFILEGNLKEIDLTGLNSLKEVAIQDNETERIRIVNCRKLEKVTLGSCESLRTLKIAGNSQLKSVLVCKELQYNENLKKLESKYKGDEFTIFSNTQIENNQNEFEVKLPIKEFRFRNNGSPTSHFFDIGVFDSLQFLDCSQNNLETISGLSKNIGLNFFRSNNNKIESLDLSECAGLQIIRCVNTKSCKLYLDNLLNLKEIILKYFEISQKEQGNEIKGDSQKVLSFERSNNLEKVWLSNCTLEGISFEKNAKIKEIKCENNKSLNSLGLGFLKNDSIERVYVSSYNGSETKKLIDELNTYCKQNPHSRVQLSIGKNNDERKDSKFCLEDWEIIRTNDYSKTYEYVGSQK